MMPKYSSRSDRIYVPSSHADCAPWHPGKPTAPASPWQNAFAERLIGHPRECLDHIMFLVRRICADLRSYACYYNDTEHIGHWTRWPVSRRSAHWIISSHAILGGLIITTPA